jgi:hypothetical protein
MARILGSGWDQNARMDRGIILMSYKSELTFCRKLGFPIHCVLDEIHCEQCRQQLLNNVDIANNAAED